MSGLSICGLKWFAFLTELSKLMDEAIARDEQPRMPAYEPGGARHIPYKSASDTTKKGPLVTCAALHRTDSALCWPE